MAERSIFFNSTTNDRRTYQAQDFANYFGKVLSTGLLHTDEEPGMKVTVEVGTLNTIISPGSAIMKGHLYENTTSLTLSHSIPEPTLDRVDRIVLRLDLRSEQRNIKLHVKEGTSASAPTAPVLQRDNAIYELSLAQVRVRANTVQLISTDLVDERLDEKLCGIVHSLISIPTDQLQSYIASKKSVLDNEMNAALDSYLQSLLDAERQLQGDLANWNQQWTNWFNSIQGGTYETVDGVRKQVEQTDFKVTKSNKDVEGVFRTVEYRRGDNTLAIRSVLSGGISPKYTTRTITYYGTNGNAVEKTTIRTLTYDADGDLAGEE